MTDGPPLITTLNDRRYFIQSTKASLSARLIKKLDTSGSEFVAVTTIPWAQSAFQHEDLQHICSQYRTQDDVWNDGFLSLVILLLPGKLTCKPACARTVCVDNSKARLPSGPLMIRKGTGEVFKVSMLVPDTYCAFISAMVPTTKTKSSFREFSSTNTLEIALPSRLYFQRTDKKPFAGLRVAVKDTIALKGLRTGYGSQAWKETYAPEEETAPCVQMLLDAGAVVVGKVKSSEFAEGVDPTDWTEGVCPYNPRGDGQQKPSSSSTGSASATAAYPWLDVAYGTDTGGSIRHPAGVQGLFGQRPTHGRIDLTGVLGATSLFNTVGIFARDVETFTKVGGYLVDRDDKPRPSPRRRKYNLLYPTRPSSKSGEAHRGGQHRWFPHPEVDPSMWTEAEKQMEATISQIEAELDCTRVPFNIDELWSATHPIGQSRSLDEATGPIYGVITTSSACETGIDQFVKDYATAHEGRPPPISTLVQERMDYGRACTNEQIATALQSAEAFSRWVLHDLFGSLDQEATTLLIFPQSCGLPDYRDDAPDHSNLFKEFFSIYSFAYLCGCPDYTIPIGEVAQHSRITKQDEYLPVSLSLVGRPGTDLELFDVVDLLHTRGVILDVQAGKRMYADKVV